MERITFNDIWFDGFKAGEEVRSTLLCDIYDELIRSLRETKPEGYEHKIHGLTIAKDVIKDLQDNDE